jgi:endonuclease/exonuclease/phosphatase family metal-dependent hydrolase
MPPCRLRRGLAIAVLSALLVLCLAAIVALPALTHGLWPLVILAVLLAGLLLSPAGPHFRRSRRLFACLIAGWLGLLGWAQMSRGGLAPPAKANPQCIRIVTWNIHCGQDEGPPWQRFDWPARKHALRAALDQAGPDILCVQEARPGQVAFLEQALPGHERIGVGRDDGHEAGEHCAIFFDRQRFERLDGGTFWLEEPIDTPRPGSALAVKRICTWVRLYDRRSNRVLRLYNSHLPLTEGARRGAALVLLGQIAAGESSDFVVLTADFNAPPSAVSRRLFTEAGLDDSAILASERPGMRTFHLYGIPLRCLDGILVGPGAKVDRHLRLDVKPGDLFPSDHFGLLADLSLTPGDGPCRTSP